MRALTLDFVRRRSIWPGAAMALVGAVLAFDAGSGFLRLREEVHTLSSENASQPVREAAEPVTEQTLHEIEAARRLLADLALPWEKLFRSVERAVDRDTALLSIEPDVGKQTLQITGEARNFTAVLRFIGRLEREGSLARVHLLNHEVREEAPERPTQFRLSASWRAAP